MNRLEPESCRIGSAPSFCFVVEGYFVRCARRDVLVAKRG